MGKVLENGMELADGRVFLHAGDCLEVLASLPENSIDAVVTDPPYHFTSIVKRFGSPDAAPAQFGSDGAFARASRGFMGKEWDGGDIAFRPDTWALIWRVLKPGGHMVAFGAPKNYHRLACAIEDAGFEIRDSLMWVFGTGFPKSMDVAKTIDKKSNEIPLFDSIREHIRFWRDERGLTNKDLNAAVGSANNGCGMARHWTSLEGSQHSIPSKEQWRNLKRVLDWPDCELDTIYASVKDGAQRPIVGVRKTNLTPYQNIGGENESGIVNITAPATDAAKQWAGWGTALKPAYEPIVLARKPLSEGTVAANVLRWGTGALNIDATRIATDENRARNNKARASGTSYIVQREDKFIDPGGDGRWPANLCHDGSQQVLDLFPHTRSGNLQPHHKLKASENNSMSGGNYERNPRRDFGGDEGSAARFFYSPKASKQDRAGSKHPTVKPINLMRWLVRMVTPPGGTVLDPFAGSGTTAQAAVNEGFQAVLIEREEEYQSDIRNRLSA